MANYLCIAIILLAQILHATSNDYSTVVRSNAQNTFASPRKKTDGSAAPVRRSNEPFPTNNEPPRRTNNEPPRRTNNEPPRRRIQQPTSSLKKRYPQIIRSRSVYHKRPTSSAIRRPSSSSSNRVPINRQYRPSPPIRSRRPPPRGIRLLSRAERLRGASKAFYQRKSLRLGKSTGKHRAANRPRVASRVPGKGLSSQKHYYPRGRAPPPNAAWTGAGPGAATPKNVG